MEERFKEIILTMADHDMNVKRVAEVLHYHRNTMVYQLNKIQSIYGLDPRKFYDLCKLVEMVKEG